MRLSAGVAPQPTLAGGIENRLRWGWERPFLICVTTNAQSQSTWPVIRGPAGPGCPSTGCKGKSDAAYKKHSYTKSANPGSGVPRIVARSLSETSFERLINGVLYEI